MSFFGSDYRNAGVGIAKNAPKKKPFFAFLDILGRKFWKLLVLNLINCLFFLPSILALLVLMFSNENNQLALPVTIVLCVVQALLVGPSIAGMTKVLRNYTLEKHAYVWADYMEAAKKNFKYAAIIGFFDVLLGICIGCGVYVYPDLIESTGNSIIYVPFVIMFSIGITVIMMNFYAFPMLVSTTLSLKGIIKDSLALTCIAFKKNIITFLLCALIVVLFAVLIILDRNLILLLTIMPASFLGLIICFNCYPVIQKYVINPFYEQRGEVNPELGGVATTQEQDTLFEDQGGKESPIKVKKDAPKAKKNVKKGKIIS